MWYAEHHHVGSHNFTVFLYDSKTVKLYIVDGSCTVIVEIGFIIIIIIINS